MYIWYKNRKIHIFILFLVTQGPSDISNDLTVGDMGGGRCKDSCRVVHQPCCRMLHAGCVCSTAAAPLQISGWKSLQQAGGDAADAAGVWWPREPLQRQTQTAVHCREKSMHMACPCTQLHFLVSSPEVGQRYSYIVQCEVVWCSRGGGI